MAKVSLLVDTDVWINYFNLGRLSQLFEDPSFTIYYSVVTRKELLSKVGLRDSERQAILFELKRHREIRLTETIARKYWDLRMEYPSLEKEDALIAATALAKRLPFLTGNWKDFQGIKGIRLFRI